MEIIAELVIQVAGFLLQFLAELVLQIMFGAIAAVIGHSIKEPFRPSQPPRPWLAAIGYGIFGAIAGGLSLWMFPDHFIEKGWLRWVNLLVVPLGTGAALSAIGAWRRHRDMRVIKLDFFGYGYCFALGMTVVRFAWGG